jgi:hypothetical protein
MKNQSNQSPHSPHSPEYLFESFLPYREALNLGRALYSLCRLKKLLLANKDIEEQIIERLSFSLRYLLPNVKPANMSQEEFDKTLQKEREEKLLSEEELRQKIETESEKIREQIDSGEIDIWDDSPHFIDNKKCEEYLEDAIHALKSKIIDHLNPQESFFEKIVKETHLALTSKKPRSKTPKDQNWQTGFQDLAKLQALLRIWDYAKISYEKEPPYKIVFSEQVAEFLGIDPIMESIKLQELRPLTKREKIDLKRLNSVIWRGKPSASKTKETPFNWATKSELDSIFKMAQRKNAKTKPDPYQNKNL